MPACGSPHSGSVKKQARVRPSQVLVDSRRGHERVQRGVVCGQREVGGRGERWLAASQWFLAAVASRVLRFHPSTVCLLAAKLPQLDVSLIEWTRSRVRA